MRLLPNRILFAGAILTLSSVAVLTCAFAWSFSPVQADETGLAWAAKQTAMGRAPYADFFSFVPPLSLYGVGAFFKLFGPSLGALRVLTVLWITLCALILYGICLRGGLTPFWAFSAAFSLPSLFVPEWPVPSHHWFAVGFGLGAVFLSWEGERAGACWLAAGFLTGSSALCLQTEGAFFFSLFALRFWLAPPGRKKLTLFAAGAAFPLLLSAALLAARGALGRAVYDLAIWPARYYRQSGGFNDVDPFRFMAQHLRSFLPAGPTLFELASAARFLLALCLPALCLLMPCLSPEWLSPRRPFPRRWAMAALATAACFLLYTRGRSDWTHLVLWSPVLIFLLVDGLDWERETWRPALVKGWLCLALLAAVLRWCPALVLAPPRPAAVLGVDERYRSQGLPALLSRLPRVREDKLPVLCLGKEGSALYFFWAPEPPPVDWLMPLSARYNAPWEYEALARFAERNRVPYIIIPDPYAEAFQSEPSAIRQMLESRYQPLPKTAWGSVFQRNLDAERTD